MIAPMTEMPQAMRMPTTSDGTECGKRSLNSTCWRDELCIKNKCTRFSSTLTKPCVVLAMMGAREKMKVISMTDAAPDPIQSSINGAIATIGTVCSNNV